MKHLGVDIIQRTDYYPFGLVLKTYMKEDGEDYRFGYQGEFSEEDEETGWNQFEARMWDPLIGRWLTTDPARQFYSPYNGMGNDPINSIDPDGRFKNWISAFGAWVTGGFQGSIEKATGGDRAGEYFIGKQIDYTGEGLGVAYERVFDVQADINFNGAISIGPQAAEYVHGVPGFDLTIVSFSIVNFNFEGQFSFDNGFSTTKSDLIPIWESSEVKSKIGIDVPFVGGSVEQSFNTRFPNATLKRQLEVHGGLPGIGVKNTYDLVNHGVETTLSGGAGYKAIIGGEVSYDLGFTRIKD